MVRRTAFVNGREPAYFSMPPRPRRRIVRAISAAQCEVADFDPAVHLGDRGLQLIGGRFPGCDQSLQRFDPSFLAAHTPLRCFHHLLRLLVDEILNAFGSIDIFGRDGDVQRALQEQLVFLVGLVAEVERRFRDRKSRGETQTAQDAAQDSHFVNFSAQVPALRESPRRLRVPRVLTAGPTSVLVAARVTRPVSIIATPRLRFYGQIEAGPRRF
jgi:hypothetical protein